MKARPHVQTQPTQLEPSGSRNGVARRLRVFQVLAVGLLSALCAAPSAWAQGCVLCYTSAAGAPGAAAAFKWGVLTLLVPALLLFIAVFLLIFRRARAASQAESALARPPAVRLASSRKSIGSRLRTALSPSSGS